MFENLCIFFLSKKKKIKLSIRTLEKFIQTFITHVQKCDVIVCFIKKNMLIFKLLFYRINE